MGLPHVLVRFYTNPDGRAARRTTLVVLGLLGVFYLLPVDVRRARPGLRPDLVGSGRTDAVVLVLPDRLFGGPVGRPAAALLGAGAFAAFLSTASGLVVSVAGVAQPGPAQPPLRPAWSRLPGGGGRRRRGRPASLALASPSMALAHAVGLAFAVAASTFCPLLVLGIWWRGLTAPRRRRRAARRRRALGQRPSSLVLLGRRPGGGWWRCSARTAGPGHRPGRLRDDGRRLAG